MKMTLSLMFHHFHDENHLPSQGSLSSDSFAGMLDWVTQRCKVLSAVEYMEKLESESLDEGDVCLSFDDNLLCQWDIAVPVLQEKKIQAFFFIYSSVFQCPQILDEVSRAGWTQWSDRQSMLINPGFVEVFRYFRTVSFDNLEDFYEMFITELTVCHGQRYLNAQELYKDLDYLAEFPFYTESDKWFRYLRDEVLGVYDYNQLMFRLINKKKFDAVRACENLWMTEAHLKALHDQGHVIGLHSYSHPTQMTKLSRKAQELEYQKNLQDLESVLGEGTITSMAHPCGDYNEDTLAILKAMGIRIGFRSSMAVKEVRSSLEIPRDDHANILREMRK